MIEFWFYNFTITLLVISLSLIILYGLSIGHTFAGSYLKELATYSVMFVGGVFSNIFYISSDKELNNVKL